MAVNTVSSVSGDVWQLIGSSSLTSGTSYSFTSIAGYKTLMLAFKGVTTASTSYMAVRFNNDSSAGNYNSGTGGETSILLATNTATARGGAAIVYDADKTVAHKIEKSNYGAAEQDSAFYTDPVAITRVDLISRESSAFTAGTVYLYGIAA
jgi:hypothetical protein